MTTTGCRDILCTWAHSTWAADAVGPALGWGGLGSQSADRPEKPLFSWNGLHWHDPTRGAAGWDRSTPGNTKLGPALESRPTWLYCCTILWQSLEELQHRDKRCHCQNIHFLKDNDWGVKCKLRYQLDCVATKLSGNFKSVVIIQL